jgi:lipid II:glycine glycyltransferase (peptidoglycan interpeptide bridge formation enzyme)
VLEIFDALHERLRFDGARTLVYKPVPHIYHRVPAEEDLYALTRHGAVLERRDLSSAIHLESRPRYSKGRRWGVKRADRAGVEVSRSDDFAGFMAMVADALRRHDATPTHSATELELLASLFPDEIVLYEATHEGTTVAGVVLYETPVVSHTQYIAATEAGRELSALDLLLDRLIERAAGDGRRWFNFGISTEEAGRLLNEGLVAHKEGFGARAVAFDHYRLDLGGR